MSTKILDRISALLAQAEGTDNEHERDAFVTKAQELATNSSIDLEIARQHQRNRNKRENPVQERITLFGYGSLDGRKRQRSNRARFVRLFLNIAAANDVQCNIYHDSTGVIAFGFPSDIEVCKALYASLSVQMIDAANQAVKAGEHKKEENLYYSPPREKKVTVRRTDPWGDTYDSYDYEWVPGKYRADARVFKSSFYDGFASKIHTRLMAAKREAEKAQAERQVTVTGEDGVESSTSVALVLVGKKEEVRSFYKTNSTAKGSWGGERGARNTSYGAYSSGSKAGASAQIGARPAISGAKGEVR